MVEENEITEKVIGAAIEVHRHLGPGLLESAYEECLCFELSGLGLRFQRQASVPIVYKGIKLQSLYKVDLFVENAVIVELKAVEDLLPVHKAQLLTYLKDSNTRVGLLINFNVPVLINGLKRMVNHHLESASLRNLSDLCVSAVKNEAQ
jgi:GxxExxY protein